MGTITMDPYGTDEIRYKDDKYLGRTAENDIWDILRIHIIVPLREKGYVDVRERISDTTPVSEIRRELKDMDSALALFDAGSLFDKNILSDVFHFESVANDINGFLQSISVGLNMDEIKALVCLVFKGAKNWKTKEAIIYELLNRFDFDKQLVYDPDIRMLYDTSVIDEVTAVDTVGKYIERIENLSRNCKGKLYFRGHGELWYKLQPSLFRSEELYKNEDKLCLKLIETCPQEFANLHDRVDMLAEMQHYAMPTRLMDVTSNALVALYFACENESSAAGEVVLLDIDEDRRKYYRSPEVIMLSSLAWMNYEEKQALFEKVRNTAKSTKINKAYEKLKAEVREERSYASLDNAINEITGYFLISPQKLNRRMVNQDGAFILCGLLDDIYDANPLANKKNRSHLEDLRLRNKLNNKKVILVINNKKKIKKQLNVYGLNQIKIYPEIDKVSEYLKTHMTEL